MQRQHRAHVRRVRRLCRRVPGPAGLWRPPGEPQRERAHAPDGGGERGSRGSGKTVAGQRRGHQHLVPRVQGVRAHPGLLQGLV